MIKPEQELNKYKQADKEGGRGTHTFGFRSPNVCRSSLLTPDSRQDAVTRYFLQDFRKRRDKLLFSENGPLNLASQKVQNLEDFTLNVF